MALDAAGVYKPLEEVARAVLEALLETRHAEAAAARADRILRSG